jgi:PhnB protein
MKTPVEASDYGTVAAHLIVRDAVAAMAFYEAVFGAKERYRLTMPGGAIAHAEFTIGNTVVMIANENPGWGNKSPETLGGTPIVLNVMCDDPDAAAAKAEAHGGKIVTPVSDHFYGYRAGRIQDPSGHLWMVSKMLEALSPEEMQQRMDAMFAGQQ